MAAVNGQGIAAPAVPAGWAVQRLPDGAIRLARTPQSRRVAKRAAALLALCGLGVTAGVFLAALRSQPRDSDVLHPLYYVPVCLLALGLLVGCGWTWLVQYEWRVSPGRLLRICKFLGRERVEHFTSGTLAVESGTDRGGATWSLLLRADNACHEVLSGVTADKEGEYRQLAALLAHYTGWPLEVPP